MDIILDRAPKAIAVLTTCTLSMTIVHDWGYFSVVGREFQSLQTPYDYLSNALAWLPINFAIFASLFATSRISSYLLGKIIGPMSSPGGFGDHRRVVAKARLRRMLFLNLLICFIFSVITFVAIPADHSEMWILILAIAWIGVSAWALVRRLGSTLLPSAVVVFIFSAPIGTAMLYTAGSLEARRDLRISSAVYQIVFKDGGKQAWKVLRYLDKGALVYDLGRQRVALLRWDRIERMERFVSSRDDETLICQYVSIGCSYNISQP